jgi:hypothetical protein
MTLTTDIETSLREVLIAALQVMQDDVSNSKVPLRAVSELRITSPTRFTLLDKLKPDYRIWLTLI